MENIMDLVFVVRLPQLSNYISFHQVFTDCLTKLDPILKYRDCAFDHWYSRELRGRGKEKKTETQL